MLTRTKRDGIRTPLKGFSIGRTVEIPQPSFEKFVNSTGRKIGKLAIIKAATNMHLTLMESRPVREAFIEKRGSDHAAMQNFAYWMVSELDGFNDHKGSVTVNPDRKVDLFGTRRDKLAICISPDEQMLNERALIEEMLRDEFGDLPKIQDFDPHITIGRVHNDRLTREQRRNPELILNGTGNILPERIVMNGLSGYLNGRSMRP